MTKKNILLNKIVLFRNISKKNFYVKNVLLSTYYAAFQLCVNLTQCTLHGLTRGPPALQIPICMLACTLDLEECFKMYQSRRSTYFIGDRHAPWDTDMLHRIQTCYIGDTHQRPGYFIRNQIRSSKKNIWHCKTWLCKRCSNEI